MAARPPSPAPEAAPASAIGNVALVRSHLIAAAREGLALSYSELLNLLGERFTRPRMRAVCKTLDRIDQDGAAAGEPELAALVVREGDGLPGQGWWTGRHGYDGPWHGDAAVAYVRVCQRVAFDYWRAAPDAA